ncbi:hypothetical protein HZS_7780, partial [Henneguya salminicola]
MIGKADQTPLTFDMLYNLTHDIVENMTVSISTTGHEKWRFTVMLAWIAEISKLKLYIVFKQKNLLKEMTLPNNVILCNPPKEWMDETLTLDLTKTVWLDLPKSSPKKSLL